MAAEKIIKQKDKKNGLANIVLSSFLTQWALTKSKMTHRVKFLQILFLNISFSNIWSLHIIAIVKFQILIIILNQLNWFLRFYLSTLIWTGDGDG